jgi:hypothetical protein
VGIKIKKRIKTAAYRQEQFEDVVTRANTGDLTALKELREILDHRPEIWREIGDMSRHAELSLLRLIAQNNTLLLESVERSLKDLRKSISPADPTPLEKMLVQRVVLAWLQMQHVDATYASTTGLTMPERKFALQLRESSQRCFDAAVKSLLTVRGKLSQLPAPTSHPPTQTGRSNTRLRVVRAAG